jgi:hypothetical protein
MRVLAEQGWLSQRDLELWHDDYVRARKYVHSPTRHRMLTQLRFRITRCREQLCGDEEWYRSSELARDLRLRAPVRQTAFSVCCIRTDVTLGP